MEGKILLETNVITINYNHFYSKISKLNNDELEGLYESIMKLVVVNISLDPHSGDDPQLIFESMNSTGLSLQESDKIRNFILMNLDANEQEKFYKNHWEQLESLVPRNDMNKFIRYYLATKRNDLTSEKNLYFVFKNFQIENKIKTEDLVNEMIMYAKWYSEIINSKIDDSGYQSVLARINRLEMHSSLPLVFYLFKLYNDDYLTEDEFVESLQIIESYIVRRFVCKLPTNQLNKVFVGIGHEVDKYVEHDGANYYDGFTYALLNKSGKSRFPNSIEFRDNFLVYEIYNSKSKLRKYMLGMLENYGTKERVAVEEQLENNILTIEHIMPQTLTQEWKDALGDSWELIHSKYKDTVGNITLTAYNSDYSNLSFEKKKDLPKKGFKYSKLDLNKYLQSCDYWNVENITNRAEELFKKADFIWGYPKSQYEPILQNEWIEWTDDYDFTYKKVKKIKFMGDEIKTSNVTDAYQKTSKLFYDLDSSLFLESIRSIQKNDVENMRKPYEVGKDIFIEMNLSSQDKIYFLSHISENFNFEGYDLQFLVENVTSDTSFDVNNEDTFHRLPVGRLAFELIKNLAHCDLLKLDDVNNLMNKDYSKKSLADVTILCSLKIEKNIGVIVIK